jgi:hypothetical protein
MGEMVDTSARGTQEPFVFDPGGGDERSQILEHLHARVASGEFSKLPTYEQLCDYYKTQRGDIRRVVHDLHDFGILHYRRGMGYFTTVPNVPSRDLSARIIQDIENGRRTPGEPIPMVRIKRLYGTTDKLAQLAMADVHRQWGIRVVIVNRCTFVNLSEHRLPTLNERHALALVRTLVRLIEQEKVFPGERLFIPRRWRDLPKVWRPAMTVLTNMRLVTPDGYVADRTGGS